MITQGRKYINEEKYWKECAELYKRQRDALLKDNQRLRTELLQATGRALDGEDYLREIYSTGYTVTYGEIVAKRLKQLKRVLVGE